MRGTNLRNPRIAVLAALVLGAVALLAVSGMASAKDRRGGDDGHHGHGHHGRHHHHFREMEEAGTISSFDPATGRLTIALRGGETVSGLVTVETRISCEGADDRRARRDHGGDDNGGGGAEPGDDNGGHGNEPGDDNGGDPTGPAPIVEGEAGCGTASLVTGAFVGDAELRLGSGAAVFEEVELGHHS
jgi:hypothetical protein